MIPRAGMAWHSVRSYLPPLALRLTKCVWVCVLYMYVTDGVSAKLSLKIVEVGRRELRRDTEFGRR